MRFLGIIMIIVLGFSCKTQKTLENSAERTIYIDSSEYEITIIDPDFDRWYMLRYSPALERTNEYYRQKNITAVSNWNNYIARNRYSNIISSYISYNPGIDYGIAVNSRLYWYFKYIEDTYRIPLLH